MAKRNQDSEVIIPSPSPTFILQSTLLVTLTKGLRETSLKSLLHPNNQDLTLVASSKKELDVSLPKTGHPFRMLFQMVKLSVALTPWKQTCSSFPYSSTFLLKRSLSATVSKTALAEGKHPEVNTSK